MKTKLKPTEIVDRFISDWKNEIQFTKQGIELQAEETVRGEAEIKLAKRFIEQLEIIKPYVYNGLDYDVNA